MKRVSDNIKIKISTSTGEFAEDKDQAALLRERGIRPALRRGQRVVVDFSGIGLATQSFVHALISDVLRSEGRSALDRMVFKGCAKSVKGIIETVVQYSLESLEPENGGGTKPKDRERRNLSPRDQPRTTAKVKKMARRTG